MFFSDYIAGGTLKNLIHDLSIPLTWLERLRCAKDIAAGMVITGKNAFVRPPRLPVLGISSLVQYYSS